MWIIILFDLCFLQIWGYGLKTVEKWKLEKTRTNDKEGSYTVEEDEQIHNGFSNSASYTKGAECKKFFNFIIEMKTAKMNLLIKWIKF